MLDVLTYTFMALGLLCIYVLFPYDAYLSLRHQHPIHARGMVLSLVVVNVVMTIISGMTYAVFGSLAGLIAVIACFVGGMQWSRKLYPNMW